MISFISGASPLPRFGSIRRSTIRSTNKRNKHDKRTCMALSKNGQTALYGGAAILISVLTNRIAFTPLETLALTQSRSDILGVIGGATLVLYGLTQIQVADKKEAVSLSGEDVVKGFDQLESALSNEVEWAASSIIQAVPNVQSFTFIMNGAGCCFMGRFRNKDVQVEVRNDGVIQGVLNKQQRAYLADMKTVPVKEVEFGFLPSNCQAVVVQPVSDTAAIVLGADKPRPFTGVDFGWVQAVSDRLADVLVVR